MLFKHDDYFIKHCDFIDDFYKHHVIYFDFFNDIFIFLLYFVWFI